MKSLILFILLLVVINLAVLFYFSNAQTKSSNIPYVIRANSIELVDKKGQTRALLNVEENGETVFRLKDAKGTIRVKLGASEEGSGLVLLDHQTNPGIHALAKKGGSITLTDEMGKKKVLQP